MEQFYDQLVLAKREMFKLTEEFDRVYSRFSAMEALLKRLIGVVRHGTGDVIDVVKDAELHFRGCQK